MELGKNYLLLTKVWSLLPKLARKGAGGGTPGNSWRGCAWPYFRPKNVIFHTCFQTRPLKSIPVFRPCLWAEIMSSLLRLERKQKISSNAFRIHIFLFSRSYSFGIEKTSMFLHSRSFLEKLYQIPDQNGKVYTRIQTMYSVAREKQPSYVLIW